MMYSAQDIVAVITAITALIAAIGAIYAAYQSREAKHRTVENKEAIHDVHISLNSRLTQLLESTAAASRAEGVASRDVQVTATIVPPHIDTTAQPHIESVVPPERV